MTLARLLQKIQDVHLALHDALTISVPFLVGSFFNDEFDVVGDNLSDTRKKLTSPPDRAEFGESAAIRDFTIANVEVSPIDLPLMDAFTVAKGEVTVARNLIVNLKLENGCIGYGEIAPFPELTGETLEDSLNAANDIADFVIGNIAAYFRNISTEIRSRIPRFAAVRCGFETAIVDAFSRGCGLPLWALWGGADVRDHETDITIPIRDVGDSLQIAEKWHEKGFRKFKLKVGLDIEKDAARVIALAERYPGVSLIIDANQGYTSTEAIAFTKRLETIDLTVEAFEQPVDRYDIDGLRKVRENSAFPIAADESVSSLEDALRVIEQGAADIINLKITKSGLFETIDIATLCKAHGIGLMIGGMIETRVAMGCSFSLVLGLGGISILDLDTPLLLAEDPFDSRGYQYTGPILSPWYEPGLGLHKRTAD